MPGERHRSASDRYFDHLGELGQGAIHPFRRGATTLLLRALRPLPGQRLLELGCGTGETLVRLARHRDLELSGIDRSLPMLRAARSRTAWTRARSRIHLARADARCLPFGDACFEAVYAESVVTFQQENDLRSIVAEAARVLRPGGRFVLNEAIWRTGVRQEEAARIHSEAVRLFGAFQTGERARDAAGWRELFARAGFRVESDQPLDGLLESLAGPAGSGSSLVSRLVLVLRRYRLGLRPEVREERRRYRRAGESLTHHGAAIEARLFVLQREPG